MYSEANWKLAALLGSKCCKLATWRSLVYWGQSLFNVFSNNLDNRKNCIFSKFANKTGRSRWYTRCAYCHPECLEQDEELGKQEPQKDPEKGNDKSCAWGGITPHTSEHWGPIILKAALQRGTGGRGGGATMTMSHQCALVTKKDSNNHWLK